jgi:hypothetical protein
MIMEIAFLFGLGGLHFGPGKVRLAGDGPRRWFGDGEVVGADDGVMEMAASEVLRDPAFTVPAGPEASTGVGWIRCSVARFCEGSVHAQRRSLTERVIARIGRPRRLSSPAATLLVAMGLPPGLEPDVAAVALAYQRIRESTRTQAHQRES